ncbi:MAG: helix-turn-helix domain-containing protein [Idiomarina sp.]|jgi:predicted XRE-type DNA-binding protein|nr:helix-turn-helix domain-containing protein [Idiomarina sp.]
MSLKCDNIFLVGRENKPEVAADLQMRSDLITALILIIRDHEWTQSEAAKHLGMTQPQVSLLMNRKINDLTTQRLFKSFNHLGFTFKPQYEGGQVSVQVKQAEVVPA